MTDSEELTALREIRDLVGKMVEANFAKGIGTLSAYIAAKDELIEQYLAKFDGRTIGDFRK